MSEIIVVGPHRLLCGDITAGAVEQLMGHEKADVSYTDPPWGQGLLTQFATMAGGEPRLPWPKFLSTLVREVAAHTKPGRPIFIEMGRTWEADLMRSLSTGLLGSPWCGNDPDERDDTKRWEVTYGARKNPRPSLLFGLQTGDAVVMPSPPHGEAVTRAALVPFVKPSSVVLDPCTGLGMTARITVELGGVFRGVELNPKRLERTVEWLRRRVNGRSGS